MQTISQSLGQEGYARLQSWLDSPAQRARRVLAVTAAAWWPDGPPPATRRAAARLARQRRRARAVSA